MNEQQKYNIYYLLIFSSIQFADAVLWSIKMKKNNVNYFITSLVIPLILSAQIVFNVFIRNKEESTFIKIFSIATIAYLFFRFRGYSHSLCEMKGGKRSSPIWGGHELELWELVGFALLIFYPRYYLILLIPLTLALTNTGYGSMWCAIGCGVAVLYLYKYRNL